MGLRESEEIGADEICDAVYIIEKRSREALLLHLGRRYFCVHHMDVLNACAHSRRRPFPMCFSIDISCRKSLSDCITQIMAKYPFQINGICAIVAGSPACLFLPRLSDQMCEKSFFGQPASTELRRQATSGWFTSCFLRNSGIFSRCYYVEVIEREKFTLHRWRSDHRQLSTASCEGGLT